MGKGALLQCAGVAWMRGGGGRVVKIGELVAHFPTAPLQLFYVFIHSRS